MVLRDMYWVSSWPLRNQVGVAQSGHQLLMAARGIGPENWHGIVGLEARKHFQAASRSDMEGGSYGACISGVGGEVHSLS